jgi:hypothetical protein
MIAVSMRRQYKSNRSAGGTQDRVQVLGLERTWIHDRDFALAEQIGVGAGPGRHAGVAGYDSPHTGP